MGGRVGGKVAIVTGAAMGIGEAAAVLLAREGAKVAVLDINDEVGKHVVSAITSNGGTAEYWHVDVTDSGRVAAAFSEISERFGRIDVLVNNAGIMGIQKPSDEIEEKEWDRVVNVDLKSVFLCTKQVVPYMKKAGGGSIINLSSILGLVGGEDPPVSCSQGRGQTTHEIGRLLLRKAQYQGELGPSRLHPHPHGKGNDTRDSEEARKFRNDLDNMTLLGHIGEPYNIAYAILYLASDESKFMTGAELNVDGGYTSV